VTVIATGFDIPERMASLDHGARVQVSVPATVPSMHMGPSHRPQESHHPRHAQTLFSSQPPPSRMDSHHAPPFSNRRMPPPVPAPREVVHHESRVQPTSQRIPSRERSATFPAFDTDWDVPAFQRKGQ
jgi:hypothetical protein